MKNITTHLLITTVFLAFFSCQNRDINEGEEFSPREIHESMPFHFDKIKVDGIEYLILEKDNNNPHEGFGFMAFRANKLMEKQDTILAVIYTLMEIQTRTYAKVHNVSLEVARSEVQGIFNTFLETEQKELDELENNNLTSSKEN